MNILLVGSGGREHALAWKIAQSPLLSRLVMAPGNPGMAALGEVVPVKATDVVGLVSLAREMAADLVVIGPESAVEAGLADALAAAGVPCFGPSQAAGQLESSKAFTKAFAERHGLPTGAYVVCDEAAAAKAALDRFSPPYVIKADGLAAGKGVVIAQTRAEAEAAIDDTLGGRFGAAGARVVIEEFLEGEIGSLFALCDGTTSMVFGHAQDHKRAYDGEKGPNTGGMGTYAPAPLFTDELVDRVRQELAEPTFAAIAAEGAPYRGVLFVEFMATRDGPRLVEFNVRFGDPECQVLMLRLESDLVPYLTACAKGELDRLPAPVWRDQAAVCVVMAAEGYPDAPIAGAPITGSDQAFGDGVVVFHAGTAKDADGTLRVAGGRVLNVCAVGPDFPMARKAAYGAVDQIEMPGGFYRSDIGWRALQR
ncbi:phosphoribosylamine--glycine ligase [Phenylobacterium sp.]|uniref:phosphoribosylamine--glycine ligase n=1 Tax=Phenylobacterium sp. TaxID=1871053 RepID=UPI00272FE11E|nr:phosphoribosylamine--glycine ligase [Phenylobacterium sp.]MDP1617854.1 phosphoribosylamine--glycine ligase [Phenylobacterium sp.]MDP1988496.1 phosphoribosylamine--glycine ligase [Phenylobacterium sp.]